MIHNQKEGFDSGFSIDELNPLHNIKANTLHYWGRAIILEMIKINKVTSSSSWKTKIPKTSRGSKNKTFLSDDLSIYVLIGMDFALYIP